MLPLPNTFKAMIKVLKEAIITLNGVDCRELLVKDYSLSDDIVLNEGVPQYTTCCDLCIYKDYEPKPELHASCVEVHGCTPNALCYFITKPL